jgi:hypothetical protein
MSYNITMWKTKVLEDFRIPISVLKELPDTEQDMLWDDGRTAFNGLSELFEIKGHQYNQELLVSFIYHGGEGSGHTWGDLKECFRKSRGKLVASQIWEGGDSITEITVMDGKVSVVEKEL